jgi:hypothetical protein
MNIILMIMSTFNLKHIVKMLYKHRYMKNSKFVISESLNLHVVKMGRWERWCVHGCWDHSHQTKPNQPTMGLGLTHTREQCFYKKQLQTWLDLFHIYIYIYNKLSVRTLFVCWNKNWWIQQNNQTDMPIVGSPTIKADQIWDTCCCQWERSYRTKGQHSVLHPNNLSLSQVTTGH